MKTVKLSEIASLTVGFVGTMAQHYTTEGIPFFRSLNIKPYRIDNSDMKYITPEFSHTLSKSELHTNDVVIVRTGIPGTCCVVPKEYDGSNCSDVVIVHPDMDAVNPHYLAAYINEWGQKQVSNNKVGAIQKHFNVHTAENMIVFLPDKRTQDAVAAILCNVNNKIAQNEAICAELESMAKTLYDFWFVQFDFPDENGKPYRTSGGKMIWREKIKNYIPEGWGVEKIDVLLEKIPTTTRIQTEGYHKDGSIAVIDQSEKYIAGYTNDCSAMLYKKDGYIVFGDHTRAVKYIRFPFARGADGTQVLSSNDERLPNELFYQEIKSIDLSNQGYARHYKFLKENVIILPDKAVARQYKEIVAPLYEKYRQVVFENTELQRLRDWLLPMLMNGQVTVNKSN